MSDCQFGYVKIEDGMVVCYTGDPNNPTIHKFHNDDIVKGQEIVNKLKEFNFNYIMGMSMKEFRGKVSPDIVKIVLELVKKEFQKILNGEK